MGTMVHMETRTSQMHVHGHNDEHGHTATHGHMVPTWARHTLVLFLAQVGLPGWESTGSPPCFPTFAQKGLDPWPKTFSAALPLSLGSTHARRLG